MKYNQSTLQKSEKLLNEAGYVIRYEKGNFNSGYCILEDKNVVVINKYFQTEAKVGAIIEIISGLKVDHQKLSEASREFYLKISQLKMNDLS
jgi:hypothetical protein